MKYFDVKTLFKSMPVEKVEARIGIYSGKAFGFISGGHTKLKYELMGEAYETAEKVQAGSENGRVGIGSSTKELFDEDQLIELGVESKSTRKSENGLDIYLLGVY
jgi:class 3 adenylate cyclase